MIFLNNAPVKVIQFPNNETKVDDKSIRQAIYVGLNSITLKYESDADLIQLLFVKKYLDEANLTASLTIPYMPYSRMDRSEDASVFTLKYICEFINSLNFTSVTLLEPHSDVTPALLNRVKLVFPTTKLLQVAKSHMSFSDEDYIFFPDAGAQKRYSKMAGQNSLVGYKQRDFQTGKITS
jgi:ribose-phosphate pyrophosphokinase